MGTRQGPRGVTKSIVSRAALERPAIEGDSPVDESERPPWVSHLSPTWKVSHVGTWADHRPRLNTLGDR
jgi:hypothetical protein